MRHYLVFVAYLLFSATTSIADLSNQHQGNQRPLLAGDRAAVLGGAFCAISDDPSGLYYNPAGLVTAERKEVSMSMLYSELRSELVYREAVKGNDFREASGTKFSSISGGIYKKGDWSFGYALLTLDHRNINQKDQFANLSDAATDVAQFDRIHQETNTYNLFGAGASYKISKIFSFGVSAFYYARNIEAMDFQFVKDNNNDLRIIASKIKTNNEGIEPVAGILLKFPKVAFGLSAKKGVNYSDRTEINVELVDAQHSNGVPQEPTAQSFTDYPLYMNEPNPLLVTLGFAYQPNHFFLLSTDVLYHQRAEIPQASSKLNDTYDYSIGTELSGSWIRLNLGAFSNRSMFDVPDGSTVRNLTHIDYTGYSCGLSLLGKNVESTFGWIKQTGKGKAQIISNSTDVQNVSGSSNNFFASAKYNF